jgi:hypothetical protein
VVCVPVYAIGRHWRVHVPAMDYDEGIDLFEENFRPVWLGEAVPPA